MGDAQLPVPDTLAAMIRQAILDRQMLLPDGFRLRGRDVSRIEGFSDAAFAFAITLLVVSLEVPATFDELLDVMRGIPGFAVCFATLLWLWNAHYKFFRRFGLQDRITLVLNSALLFVVMLYVYPLKFMFTIFMAMLTGIRPSTTGTHRISQVDDLFIIYGIGFAAVFILLALMNLRAYSLRDGLDLDELERLITRAEIARCLALAGIGLLSVVMAIVLEGGAAGFAGMVYATIAIVEFVVGYRLGRAKQRLAVSEPAPEAPASSSASPGR
jgi:uncharacterized membrane protein